MLMVRCWWLHNWMRKSKVQFMGVNIFFFNSCICTRFPPSLFIHSLLYPPWTLSVGYEFNTNSETDSFHGWKGKETLTLSSSSTQGLGSKVKWEWIQLRRRRWVWRWWWWGKEIRCVCFMKEREMALWRLTYQHNTHKMRRRRERRGRLFRGRTITSFSYSDTSHTTIIVIIIFRLIKEEVKKTLMTITFSAFIIVSFRGSKEKVSRRWEKRRTILVFLSHLLS